MLLTRTGSRPRRPAPTRTAPLALALALAACGPAPAATRDGGPARLPDPPGTWSAPKTLPAGTFRTIRHRVVALAAGPGRTLHALFAEDADGDGHADRLLHATFDGARWSAPQPIAAAAHIDSPRLAVDGDGAVHALWFRRAADDASTLVERVWTAGRWSAVTVVSAGTAIDTGVSAELATSRTNAGEIEAVLARGDGMLHRLTFAHGRWSDGASVGRGGAYLSLAAGPGGALALAQVAGSADPLAPGRGSRGNVWTSTLRGGTWSPAIGVHPNPTEQAHFPQLAWDGRGVLHAVWLEGERGDAMPTRLLHVSSADGGTTWSAADAVGTGVPGRIFYSPRLAMDGRGVLHLTFARFRDGVSYPRHYHGDWLDGRWSAAREIAPDDGERQSEIETAVDSEGRLNAVWQGADGRYRHARLVE